MTVQENLHKILWNKRYVSVPEEFQPPGIDYIIINDMTVEDRNIYSFIKKRELETARKQGVLTEIELLEEAKVADFWTPEDEFVFTKADDHIEFLRAEHDKQKLLSRKKSIQKDIDAALEKKRNVQSKKNDFFIYSADYYAAEAAAATLIRRVTCNLDGTLLWPTDDIFLHFKRYFPAFIMFVTNEVLSEGGLPIDEIREVARNPEWRLTWTLQRENLLGIFSRPIGDLTLNQKLLIYWSRVYDSAFESAEPPKADVVNDDEKFDEWLASRELNDKERLENKNTNTKDHQEKMQMLDGEYSDVCNCGAKAKNVGKGLGERIMHPRTCPWGTFRYYSQAEREEKARKTYSRNSDRVRNIMDQEQQVITQKGLIEEQHLRGKKTRHIFGMKTDVTSIKR